jgi:hypothetical protein
MFIEAGKKKVDGRSQNADVRFSALTSEDLTSIFYLLAVT